MAKYVVTNLGPVEHDGKVYVEGETVDTDKAAVEAAIKSGSLVEKGKQPAAAPAPADPPAAA